MIFAFGGAGIKQAGAEYCRGSVTRTLAGQLPMQDMVTPGSSNNDAVGAYSL
mgnify:CR=1 FL=1